MVMVADLHVLLMTLVWTVVVVSMWQAQNVSDHVHRLVPAETPVYIYICIYVCVYVYVCMYVCMCVRCIYYVGVSACMYVCMYVCMDWLVAAETPVRMHACMYGVCIMDVCINVSMRDVWMHACLYRLTCRGRTSLVCMYVCMHACMMPVYACIYVWHPMCVYVMPHACVYSWCICLKILVYE